MVHQSRKNPPKNTISDVLDKAYYSLDSPSSFAGKEKLFREAIKIKPDITRGDVDKWLYSQIPYTLHKPVRLNFKTRPVVVYDIDEQWQLDLVDLSKLSKINSGYKHLLVCIDVLSKYAWIEPLKSKSALELKKALQAVFHRDNRQPLLIQTDKGTEFFNSLVKGLFEERKIKLFTTNSERKASIVERLNRTMKSIMFKYFTRHNTRKYIDILPDLVRRYNNSFHRSIKMSPVDVNKSNVPRVWINLYENRLSNVSKKESINIGDLVRISNEKTIFQKRYEEIWTEEIFTVTHKIEGNPMVYKIKDQADESIKGTFYHEELQKVFEPVAYRIERVIRKRKSVSGKLLYYVKWKGYSSKFNSYVPVEDLQ